MILPLVMAVLSLSGQSIECASAVFAHTEALSNKAGLKVVLQVHADDDHSKESHLCMTEYAFLLVRPDGSSKERKFDMIDDAWGRSIKFWVDGFARQGQRVIATIVEGGDPPIFETVVYNLQTGTVQDFYAPPRFLTTLQPSCRESLRAIGMTREGHPVIGTKATECDGVADAWELKPSPPVHDIQNSKYPVRLTDRSRIELLETGSSSSN